MTTYNGGTLSTEGWSSSNGKIHSRLDSKRRRDRYTACRECGKPTKESVCFTCKSLLESSEERNRETQ